MAQPFTKQDLKRGEQIVQELHGLKGYDAWSECIAKALAGERDRCTGGQSMEEAAANNFGLTVDDLDED